MGALASGERMLRFLFGMTALAAFALCAIAATVFYVAPQYFRSQLALLLPHDGPTAYLVLELDADYLRNQQLENVADRMADALHDASPAIRYTGRGVVVGETARVRLVDPADMPRARRALADLANAAEGATDTIAFVEHEDGLIEARLPFAIERDYRRLAVAQSIQIIMRRLDPDGGRPIVVSASGEDRILVEARGETDYTRLREVIGPTGLLTFHLVREVDFTDAADGRLPPGTMLAPAHSDNGAHSEVVEQRPRFTGERIARAFPTTDMQTGEIVLSFQLDDEGTRIFCRITRQHAGERFAVLLDGKVVAAPRINEPICGGRGQISGNFNAQSAGQLAALLRAGALPAPLVVVEEGVRRPPPPER